MINKLNKQKNLKNNRFLNETGEVFATSFLSQTLKKFDQKVKQFLANFSWGYYHIKEYSMNPFLAERIKLFFEKRLTSPKDIRGLC